MLGNMPSVVILNFDTKILLQMYVNFQISIIVLLWK